MNFDSRKASFSLKWCHVTWSLSGQFTVFADSLQLHECVLILQLFIPLLQVIYNLVSSLKFLGQRVDLSFLLLDDFSQLCAGRAQININQYKISILAS